MTSTVYLLKELQDPEPELCLEPKLLLKSCPSFNIPIFNIFNIYEWDSEISRTFPFPASLCVEL